MQNMKLIRISQMLLPYNRGAISLDLCNDDALESIIIEGIRELEGRLKKMAKANKRLNKKIESLSQTEFSFLKETL